MSEIAEAKVADLYLRISEDRTGEELGVDRQLKRGHALREGRGWALGRVHTDNDRSARDHRKPRPGFEALLQRIESGAVKVVIAWSLDRLLRNRYDQLRLFELAEEKEIIISLVEGSDIDMSTTAGQIVADVLAGQARGEIKLKGKRQVEAQQQAAEMGKRVGGRKRFGYELDGKTIIPDEANAWIQGHSDMLRGVSLGEIARRWNAAGLYSGQRHWKDTKRGGKKGELTEWSHDTVRLTFLNPAYAGIRRYKGEEVGKAEWPALISEERFRAGVAYLKNESRRTSHGGGRENARLLTGVALCGVCGSTVHAGGGQKAKRGYRLYRCAGSGGHISRKLEPVDEFVSEVAIARLARPDAVELLIDRERPDLDALTARADNLRRKRDDLAREYAEDEDGVFTAKQFRDATATLNRKIADLEAQMADAGRAELLEPLIRAEDVRAAWEELETSVQRSVIDTLMTVTLYPVGRGVRDFKPESVVIEPKL